MFLPKAFRKVEYLGYGPGESYVDCRRNTYRARFADQVGNMADLYLKPQECGNRWGCDWAEISCACGMKLRVQSDMTFSFSVLPVTQEEMTHTKHADEVKECGSTVLCIDYKQNGIGSNSCGPKLDPRYALDEKNFTFTFSISPEMA